MATLQVKVRKEDKGRRRGSEDSERHHLNYCADAQGWELGTSLPLMMTGNKEVDFLAQNEIGEREEEKEKKKRRERRENKRFG